MKGGAAELAVLLLAVSVQLLLAPHQALAGAVIDYSCVSMVERVNLMQCEAHCMLLGQLAAGSSLQLPKRCNRSSCSIWMYTGQHTAQLTVIALLLPPPWFLYRSFTGSCCC
jgi:hypothetical protein